MDIVSNFDTNVNVPRLFSPTALRNEKYSARILVIAESLTFCIGAEVEEWLVVAARTNFIWINIFFGRRRNIQCINEVASYKAVNEEGANRRKSNRSRSAN